MLLYIYIAKTLSTCLCMWQYVCQCYRYHLDPSGTYTQYDAKAIGSGYEGAQAALQEVYNKVY